MKIRVTILLMTLFMLAQTFFAQVKVINIECHPAIAQKEWMKTSQLMAAPEEKNNSDKRVELNLPLHFILERKDLDGSGIISGDQYSSKELDHIIAKRTSRAYSYKIRQCFEFSPESGESKRLKFHFSILARNPLMSSILLDLDWYHTIPIGSYVYRWGHDLDKGKNARRMSIVSNKICVNLISKK